MGIKNSIQERAPKKPGLEMGTRLEGALLKSSRLCRYKLAKAYSHLFLIATVLVLAFIAYVPGAFAVEKTYHTDVGGNWVCGRAFLGMNGLLTDDPSYNCTEDLLYLNNTGVIGTWVSSSPFSEETHIVGKHAALFVQSPMGKCEVAIELGYSTDKTNFVFMTGLKEELQTSSTEEVQVDISDLSLVVPSGTYFAMRLINRSLVPFARLFFGTSKTEQGSVRIMVEEETVCSAPVQDLVAQNITAKSVTLKWNAPFGADSYRIYRNGSSTPIAIVTETEFTDSQLQATIAQRTAKLLQPLSQ